MAEQDYSTLTREQLEAKLAQEPPNSDDRDKGYALVYTLDPLAFASGHIPGSINVQRGQEELLEQRFSKAKEIIVYSFSPECSSSQQMQKELLSRGFAKVRNYGSGMSYWKDSGKPVATGNA